MRDFQIISEKFKKYKTDLFITHRNHAFIQYISIDPSH
jgi:hypothetical protein